MVRITSTKHRRHAQVELAAQPAFDCAGGRLIPWCLEP
jgi:hypothetical protein